MKIPRFVVSTSVMVVTMLSASTAMGQDYPNKPIRIVTSQPGGGSDFNARLIAIGYEAGSRQGIWAPAKTPAAIIQRLNQEIVRYLSMPEVKERLLGMGIEAAPSSPEQFAAVIKSEMVRNTTFW